MLKITTFSALALACLLAAASANAQDSDDQPPIDFAGGKLTITENADGENVLAFDGKELARNYVLAYERTVDLLETPVALFEAGDGGNACGTRTVMVWKAEDGTVKADMAGDDCGSPDPAVTESRIYFVPYLLPGESADIQSWAPDEGFSVAGSSTFVPQPGTGWASLEAKSVDYMLDAFSNADVFNASKALLGDELTGVATSLLVGSEPDTLPDGTFYAWGCVPHACGGSDGFMAVDPKGQKVYFAQQTENAPKTWPDLAGWPTELRAAMEKSLAERGQ